MPRKGDVILTREAPLGEVGILRDNDTVFMGQRLVSYRANEKYLAPSYLLYTLMSDELQAQIRGYGSGSTVEHMRVPDAKKLRLPLPSLVVQRRIAAVLSAYDDLIENNRRRIAILEEMARNLYREWFVEFRFPGHEGVAIVERDGVRAPEGWEVTRLGEVIELAYGKALKADIRRPGNVPVYGSSGVTGFHDESLVGGPGIIVGRKGNVGSVFWSDMPFFPIDTVFYVQTDVSLYYTFFNLQSQNFINNDAAVPGLSRNQAYSLPFVLPPSTLLRSFDAFIADDFRQLSNLRRRNDNLRRTRDLLLPRLVSGELDVSELEIAGAEAAESEVRQ